MPRVRLTRRQLLAFGVFAVSVVAFLYLVLPKLAGVSQDVQRIEKGDKWWVAVGVAFEVISFGGYVVLFRTVLRRVAAGGSPGGSATRSRWPGCVATRLFAAAGAGGIALTAWALRRSGMESAPGRLPDGRLHGAAVRRVRRLAADRRGRRSATGAFPGGGSFAITVVPAIAGFVLFVVTGAIALLPKDLERAPARAGRRARAAPPHLLDRGVAAPALAASGVRTAMDLIRERRPGAARARSCGGRSTSSCCGRCSTPSARRPRCR